MNRRLIGFLIVISCLAPALFAETIRCESDRGHRRECSFDGWGRVELSRQLSRTDCIEGRTWGVAGRHAVWVSDGCRADFHIRREDNRDNRYDRRSRSTKIHLTEYASTQTQIRARAVSARRLDHENRVRESYAFDLAACEIFALRDRHRSGVDVAA